MTHDTDALKGDDLAGLSDEQARERLARDGFNELPRQDRRTPLRIVLEVLREPMLLLLLAGGAIYLALGDLTEAIVLIVFATLSVVITVVQETRTERVLEALRDLTSPRALVIRGGERKRIAGRDVVVGDVLVLGEGDRVAADSTLLRSVDLAADESLLTGESAPVRKTHVRGQDRPAHASWRRRSPVRLFGIAHRAWFGPCAGACDGREQRGRPHRASARRARRHAAAPADADPPAGVDVRQLWHIVSAMAVLLYGFSGHVA